MDKKEKGKETTCYEKLIIKEQKEDITFHSFLFKTEILLNFILNIRRDIIDWAIIIPTN